MKLTKREAIERTKQLWEALAEHPAPEVNAANHKYYTFCRLWPEYSGERGVEIDSSCWACEYALQKKEEMRSRYLIPDTICSSCPIWTDEERCTTDGQAYVAWHAAKTGEQRTKAALGIVALCDKALAELDRRGL